jgi:hypothetical protein
MWMDKHDLCVLNLFCAFFARTHKRQSNDMNCEVGKDFRGTCQFVVIHCTNIQVERLDKP